MALSRETRRIASGSGPAADFAVTEEVESIVPREAPKERLLEIGGVGPFGVDLVPGEPIAPEHHDENGLEVLVESAKGFLKDLTAGLVGLGAGEIFQGVDQDDCAAALALPRWKLLVKILTEPLDKSRIDFLGGHASEVEVVVLAGSGQQVLTERGLFEFFDGGFPELVGRPDDEVEAGHPAQAGAGPLLDELPAGADLARVAGQGAPTKAHGDDGAGRTSQSSARMVGGAHPTK